MADRITGLGQTIDQYQVANGYTTLNDLYARVSEKFDGAKKYETNFGKLSIDNGQLMELNKPVCDLDDFAYENIGKLLGIPTAYLARLNNELKRLNIEFWFDQLAEKEVRIWVKNNELIEVAEGMKIEIQDVLKIANVVFPEAYVFSVNQQTNSTIIDVYSETYQFDTSFDTYFGGMRIIVKNGLVAPEITPIFLNVNSCGIVECNPFSEKLIIKNLTYKDILRAIQDRMENCVASLHPLFDTFEEIMGDQVPEPRRRISHYCREHAMPDRVNAYAAKVFDETGIDSATVEDLVCIFSTLGYVDEIKQSSAMKLHRLAGHIIVRSHGEKRCQACDAMLLEE